MFSKRVKKRYCILFENWIATVLKEIVLVDSLFFLVYNKFCSCAPLSRSCVFRGVMNVRNSL